MSTMKTSTNQTKYPTFIVELTEDEAHAVGFSLNRALKLPEIGDSLRRSLNDAFDKLEESADAQHLGIYNPKMKPDS